MAFPPGDRINTAQLATVIEEEIRAHGSVQRLCEVLAQYDGTDVPTVTRWLYRVRTGESETISVEYADRLLTALGRQEILDTLLPEPEFIYERLGHCEDCGGEVEADVEPIDLFRVTPSAMEGRVWDSTKQRWARRPRNARAGGRRVRPWRLCRLCRAQALRARAGTSTMTNGKKRYIRKRERIAPKRGGRPRLLTDRELRAAHTLYMLEKLSIGALADELNASREKGTRTGYYQSLLYGWRRLKLPLRDRGQQIAFSRHGTDGTKSKPHKQRCSARVVAGARKGKQCMGFARIVRTDTSSHPAEDGLCWNHADKQKGQTAKDDAK
jgi:hypothetical protein